MTQRSHTIRLSQDEVDIICEALDLWERTVPVKDVNQEMAIITAKLVKRL